MTSPKLTPSSSALAIEISAQVFQDSFVTGSGISWSHGSAAPVPSPIYECGKATSVNSPEPASFGAAGRTLPAVPATETFRIAVFPNSPPFASAWRQFAPDQAASSTLFQLPSGSWLATLPPIARPIAEQRVADRLRVVERAQRRLDQRAHARARVRVAPALDRRVVGQEQVGRLARLVRERREGDDETDLREGLREASRGRQREDGIEVVHQQALDAARLHLIDEAEHVGEARRLLRVFGGVGELVPDRAEDDVQQQHRRRVARTGSRRSRDTPGGSATPCFAAASLSTTASKTGWLMPAAAIACETFAPLTAAPTETPFFLATALARARARTPSEPAEAATQ